MTEDEAQAALAEIALQLVAIQDRLLSIKSEVPLSLHREQMWEHRVPRDLATEIYGVVECVLVDLLRPMIEELEDAAQMTTEKLRARFRHER